MDFVVGLPWTQKSYDSIWVVVDQLTKSTHFIPVKSTYLEEDYARIFLDEIVYRHVIHCLSYLIGVHNSYLDFGGRSKKG